jgi:CRISPR-associated protein Csm1
MMHYTSFIPHETLISPLPKIGLPDISLFDHLWLTAAFSSCLYNLAAQRHEGKVPTEVDWEREKGKYLLVVGDFSGVQDFLFSISSRGALKSLRARSFFLELLALHISELIVRKLNLSPLNVLYATGGRFTILAPYTEEASDFDGITGALPQIRREINDYLVNAHDARLYLVMKWFPYLEDRHFLHPEWLLRGMGDILGAIKIEKSRKYEYEHHEPRFRALLEPWEARASEPKLKKGTIWECIRCNGKYPRRYIKVSIPKRYGAEVYHLTGCSRCLPDDVWESEENKGECHICHCESAFLVPLPEYEQKGDERGNERRKEPVPVCPFCDALFHMGEHLPGGKFVVRKEYYEPAKAVVRIEDNAFYYVKDHLKEEDASHPIWLVNKLSPLSYDRPNKWFLFTANHQPSREENGSRMPLDFEELAKISVGAERIGVLRMDVDNLGDLFKDGLKEKFSLARWISLSRQLELFFKLHMNQFCKGKGFEQNRAPFTVSEFSPERETEEGMRGRKAVIIYSGGDDIFIVGAWNEVVELGVDIHRAFKAYVSNNPEVDISAGVLVCSPHYPLYHMAVDGKDALREAKGYEVTEKCLKKASLNLFYSPISEKAKDYTVRWETPPKVSDIVSLESDVIHLLQEFLTLKTNPGGGEDKSIRLALPRSFLHKLMQLCELYKDKTSGPLYLPAMARAITRQTVPGTQLQQSWEELKLSLMQPKTIRYLPIVLTWLDLLTRERSG